MMSAVALVRDRFSRWLTPGECQLGVAALVAAAFGALLAFVASEHLNWSINPAPDTWSVAERWLVLTGGLVSGALMLFLRRHFGHGGMLGLIRSAAAGIWLLFLAGVIVGTLNMPLWGTTFGVVVVMGTLWKSPVMLVYAIGTLAIVHWLCRLWQMERRSVLGFGEAEF